MKVNNQKNYYFKNSNSKNFGAAQSHISRRAFIRRTGAASIAVLASARAGFEGVPGPTPASSKPFEKILVGYRKTTRPSGSYELAPNDWENNQKSTLIWVFQQIYSAAGSTITNIYEWGDPADYESVSGEYELSAETITWPGNHPPYYITYSGGKTVTKYILKKKKSTPSS